MKEIVNGKVEKLYGKPMNIKTQKNFEVLVDLADSEEMQVTTLKAAGGKLRKIMHQAFHVSALKKRTVVDEKTK